VGTQHTVLKKPNAEGLRVVNFIHSREESQSTPLYLGADSTLCIWEVDGAAEEEEEKAKAKSPWWCVSSGKRRDREHGGWE
jgi:hypothetical protein